jgi:acetyl esterase
MMAMAAIKLIRMKAGALVVDNAFRGLSRLGRLHPGADPRRHGVEVVRDVAYLPTGRREHTLDIYRPRARRGPLPVVLYVHGGGFRILSKDTHWLMALAFARRGYLVFNINYRLAPLAPYPAAIADACAAYVWVERHAAGYGGDLDRLTLAGESAGANLVTALTVAATMARPEPYAREVFATGRVPRAVLPACGLLQVSDPERFARRKPLPGFISDRIEEVSHAYLGRVTGNTDLADPLLVLERDTPSHRSIPPFFTFVGTRDPILDDTRRLHAALVRRGVHCDIRYFPGEAHAFHALMWRPSALECWRATHAFLEHHVLDRSSSVCPPR